MSDVRRVLTSLQVKGILRSTKHLSALTSPSVTGSYHNASTNWGHKVSSTFCENLHFITQLQASNARLQSQ